MSVVYKNSREIVEIYVVLMEHFTRFSCEQSGRKAELSSLSVATTAQSFSRQGNMKTLEVLMNYYGLTPPRRSQ